ncbi:MAG: bifunctional nicotinamide mononucleotide adenylyltransferase/ADP-ribose pyrophosphatase [Bacteroidetes bacterium ADurb.Bin416]|nr:MAG: bifunctional nicotinamide mononucleotide adenylyltransferase/ADP-ribose pyrophosphatase [Bacteroidetes bacterium ADurb.Bin416]
MLEDVKTNYYKDNDRFYLSVDCIIFGFHKEELNLLLIKRNFNPCKGNWSLVGGFLKKDESLDQTAQRVLHELTGLNNVFMEQVGSFGAIDRDPGERVVSTAYYALINIEDYDPELATIHNAHWVKLSELPPLIFDHKQMVDKALRRLKRQVSNQSIGYNLLPKLFTLSQFQQLYEAILGKTLDKRNFRKKVADMDFLEKTDEKDKLCSKRGAFLYRFCEMDD